MDFVLRKIIALCAVVQEWCWQRLGEPTWRSFSGKIWRIKDMSDEHLVASWRRVVRTNQVGPQREWLLDEIVRRGIIPCLLDD